MKRTTFMPLLALLALPALAQPPAPQGSRADQFINTLDSNKDGKVEEAEFLKPFKMQFQMLDSNKDGYLEKAEIQAMEDRMRQRRQQMQQMRRDERQGQGPQ